MGNRDQVRFAPNARDAFFWHSRYSRFQTTGFTMLDVRPHHAAAVDELAHLHADPFDRLILAQALTEPMQMVTHDHRLKAYGDTIISW